MLPWSRSHKIDEPDRTMDAIETPSEELNRDFIKSEWENYRYQDGLRWSRIQTIALIEVALLTGVYTSVGGVTWLMKLVLAFFLTIMVGLLALFAEIDGRDADSHLRRALAMEQKVGLPAYTRPKRPAGLRGHRLMQIGCTVLLSFNLVVIGDMVRHLHGKRYGRAVVHTVSSR